MEQARFDRFVKHFATMRSSRRASLRAAGVGIIATVAPDAPFLPGPFGPAHSALAEDATPAAAATPAPEINLEGTWLCSQPYALCSMSACDVTPSSPRVATCPCTVEQGYSIGYRTCAERAATGQTLFSTFSTANVTSSVRAMMCSEQGAWANCLDMPCIVDPDDSSRATCLCPLEESGDYLTAGGECDVSTCSSVIWSAASSSGNLGSIFQTALAQVGETPNLPAVCPGGAPPATPPGG